MNRVLGLLLLSTSVASCGGKIADGPLLADGRLDVCSVLTKEDAVEALGRPVRDGTSDDPTGPRTPASQTHCLYWLLDAKPNTPENTYKVLGVHDFYGAAKVRGICEDLQQPGNVRGIELFVEPEFDCAVLYAPGDTIEFYRGRSMFGLQATGGSPEATLRLAKSLALRLPE